jgi:hypothetical protein
MADRSQAADVGAGQIRRHEALGTTSTYRVVAVDAPIALMEVLDGPGLAAGTRVRLTLDDVRAMALIDARSAPRSGPVADAA